MRLYSLRIQQFRSFADETLLLDPYTCLVGPNGSGKSTVLAALNVLFRHAGSSPTGVLTLTKEDFHHKDTSKPIVVTATFTDLSAEAEQELGAYVRQKQLMVSARAEWDEKAQSAEVKQRGARLVMKAFAPYFEALDQKTLIGDLRAVYQGIRGSYRELPDVKSKEEMATALRAYEERHPEACEPVESEDEFYGWTKGKNRLAKYIQWVYVPAVKDASTEQQEAGNTALGAILKRTIRAKVNFRDPLATLKEKTEVEYRQILAANQEALTQLKDSLARRLKDWAHEGATVDMKWHYDPEKSLVLAEPMARVAIGEDDFLGEVSRLGHGMQRTFLLSLLQELAASGGDSGPALLLGMEEPELYQHPPQARHLAHVLEQLAEGNAQVLISTHSPYFVSGRGFEAIRVIRKKGGKRATVTQAQGAQVAKALGEALGEEAKPTTSVMAAVEQIMQPSLNELYFCSVPVLVEGVEDVAFLATTLQLMGRWAEFRRLGCHFVVCGGKTNLSRPLAISEVLGIPAFLMADADTQDAKGKDRARIERDNLVLQRLAGLASPVGLPTATIWGKSAVLWHTEIGWEAKRGHEQEWTDAVEHVRTAFGLTDGVKEKNATLIGHVLEHLWAKKHELPPLKQAVESIISHATSVRSTA